MVGLSKTNSGFKYTNKIGKSFWLHGEDPILFFNKNKGRRVVTSFNTNKFKIVEGPNGHPFVKKR